MPAVSFLNQGTSPLLRELADAAGSALGGVRYYSPEQPIEDPGRVELVRMPRYPRGSLASRLLGWGRFFALAFARLVRENRCVPLFIVTNPPIAPLIGYIEKRVRRRPYALLFYDIYPETLVRFAGLSGNSPLARLWRRANRLAMLHADCVVTISERMAATLYGHLPERVRSAGIEVIPTWVDTERIRPIAKQENWFAAEHGQRGRLTVLYAGNIGAVHDLAMLPEIARRLQHIEDLHFVVAGEGFHRGELQRSCGALGLRNVTFLPHQPEEHLPYLLAMGDLAVVSLAEGAEGISMPSKTYYAMAAGSALFGISTAHSPLAGVISEYGCGVNVEPGDVEGAVSALLRLHGDRRELEEQRGRARRAAVERFSREVCVPRMVALVRNLAAIETDRSAEGLK